MTNEEILHQLYLIRAQVLEQEQQAKITGERITGIINNLETITNQSESQRGTLSPEQRAKLLAVVEKRRRNKIKPKWKSPTGSKKQKQWTYLDWERKH